MPSPRLLLLDEPATGLDVAARERLLAGISALAAANPDLATVTVTHRLEELPTSTTHAALLRDGRLFAAGPAPDTLTTANVSWCFDYQLTITRLHGRWTAHTS
jgi:iron complex transport system ATP-binding protein